MNHVFTADSDLVTALFKHDVSGYIVYDNSLANTIGVEMAMCPGRFFLEELYLSRSSRALKLRANKIDGKTIAMSCMLKL